jgi:hypothetical protein
MLTINKIIPITAADAKNNSQIPKILNFSQKFIAKKPKL